MICAVGFGQFSFLFGRGRSNHCRSDMLRQLRHEQTKTSGHGVDEDNVALLNRVGFLDEAHGRQGLESGGGGDTGGDGGWDRVGFQPGHEGVCGVRAQIIL